MLVLGNRYEIKGGVVHWRGIAMPKADAATFQHLGSDWGRDSRHVFVQDKVKKIDVSTFAYLNPLFVKDAAQVYDWKGPIPGADPNTFEVLDSGVFVDNTSWRQVWARGYARDSKAVYYQEEAFGRTSVLRGADPQSFVSLGNDYGHDHQYVWHQKSRLPKADPQTWFYLGRLWSMDQDRLYFCNREVDADRECFTVVNVPTTGIYATDGERFFFADHQISEEEFWTKVNEDIGSIENVFRVQYHLLRKTCKRCNGSGECWCRIKGTDTATCLRCHGNGLCDICGGKGRIK